MSLDKPPLARPIEAKIAWAEACRDPLKEALENAPRLTAMIARFREAVEASRREMAATGIVRLCRQCEEDEGGSCCGEGLENRYDPWLLLINLLLGVPLPHSRRRAGSCYFLGDSGCLLSARHTICLNYICAKITDRVDPEKISRLREREGVELDALFLLHEEVKGVVRRLT
ncbi:MAG: hypothetical protein JRK53_11550 [Deltaproteobacteria bacterium]|nr:hypothetical protein [Deltaproteobacteria bacterium]MBW2284715.1 hypothetical protein [Deltaproteobacteria bacterium]